MEFHQLRYFVAAAEELSVTAAAKRLRVSQPALSKQIANLEEEVGTALFDRIRQRIHLTDAGRFFLPKARQILCDAEMATQQLRENFGHEKRTLRLGFLSPFLDDIVAPAVKSFRRQSRRHDVALFELSARAQLDRIRDGELDVGLLGNVADEDRRHVATKRVMRSRMAAVLPIDHRLAGRKRIALSELSGDDFVSLSDTYFPGRRQFLFEMCESQGFEPEVIEESDTLTLMLVAIATGSGVGLLPEHSAKLPHEGAVFVPLSAPTVHADVLAVRRRGGSDPSVTRLMDHLLGN